MATLPKPQLVREAPCLDTRCLDTRCLDTRCNSTSNDNSHRLATATCLLRSPSTRFSVVWRIDKDRKCQKRLCFATQAQLTGSRPRCSKLIRMYPYSLSHSTQASACCERQSTKPYNIIDWPSTPNGGPFARPARTKTRHVG
jgi:hypothetical protein